MINAAFTLDVSKMEGHRVTPVVIFLSLLYSTCNSVPSDSWCIANSGNQTIMPHSNPNTVFETYGYSDKGIPRDLSVVSANLLHEESVLHVLNHLNQFKLHNEGFIAKLYEGEMKGSGEKILVKRLNEGNFDNILNEAVIMSYLSHNPHVPMMYGLLPTGPSYDDLSLVVQFIQNSSNIYDLAAKESLMTECNWMDISQQVASVLLDIHEHYVLFNDLHESNVVVQWRGSSPYVYIVDYGQAAFRHGESFGDTPEEERPKSDFMAPEVWYGTTSPASDVYSLGDMLLVISKFVKHHKFLYVAQTCHQEIVRNRMRLSEAKDMLVKIFQESCPEAKAAKTDDVANKATEDIARARNDAMTFTARMRKDTPLMSPVPIISWEYLKINASLGRWINSNTDVIYRTAYYPSAQSKVVIKEFVKEEFEDLRYESIINTIMNDTGYVLEFHGLVPTEALLTELCLMQEYVEREDNLFDEFVKIQNESLNFKTLLAVELSKAVATFHQRGIVINDITPENILVLGKEKIPTVKFIDLRKCTANNDAPFWELNDEYSCPSIKMQQRVTYASDVFSLGILLRNLFGSCTDFTITEMIHRGAHPNPLNRPTADEFRAFFAKKVWTSF